MKIVTKHGREYSYNPLTNEIADYVGSTGNNMESYVQFVAADDYAFDKVSMFTIELTQQCNLRCKYCIYSGAYVSRRSHNPTEMSDAMLRQCVDFILAHYDRSIPYITVCFYGGEALMAIDKMKWLVGELRKVVVSPIQYSISTNGLLLTPEVVEWICSVPDMKVTVTIDGDKIQHDKNRVTAGGRGSFDAIMHNLGLFKQNHPKEYDTRIQFLSTVHSISEIERLSEFWQSNPLLSGHRPVHISSIIPNFDNGDTVSTDAQKFIRFYDKALASLLAGEENIMTDELKRLVNIVERRKEFLLPQEQRFVTCCHEPYSCFISATGDLYVCERFCQDLTVGTLASGFSKAKCRSLVTRFVIRKNRYCSRCWAKRLCRICATNLNHSEAEFQQLCAGERMRLTLALSYYCELNKS